MRTGEKIAVAPRQRALTVQRSARQRCSTSRTRCTSSFARRRGDSQTGERRVVPSCIRRRWAGEVSAQPHLLGTCAVAEVSEVGSRRNAQRMPGLRSEMSFGAAEMYHGRHDRGAGARSCGLGPAVHLSAAVGWVLSMVLGPHGGARDLVRRLHIRVRHKAVRWRLAWRSHQN